MMLNCGVQQLNVFQCMFFWGGLFVFNKLGIECVQKFDFVLEIPFIGAEVDSKCVELASA